MALAHCSSDDPKSYAQPLDFANVPYWQIAGNASDLVSKITEPPQQHRKQ
jgi:hypothetical protein